MARPTLTRHRKFRRLARLLGGPVIARGTLELLWDQAYESGDPHIGDATDVEESAYWTGTPGDCVAALVSCGFLDATETGYDIHDLWDHAPDYVMKRRQRENERKTRGYSLDRNGLPRAVVRAVFARVDGVKCELCGSSRDIHIDHIIPRSAGGSDDLENLRLLCQACNLKKSGPDRLAASSVRRTAPNGHTPAPAPAPAPARAPLTAGLKAHRTHAVCGRVCLHAQQFEELTRLSGKPEAEADAYVRQWALGVLAAWPETQPIGDDAWAFWRLRWGEAHPSTRKAARQVQDDAVGQRWLAKGAQP